MSTPMGPAGAASTQAGSSAPLASPFPVADPAAAASSPPTAPSSEASTEAAEPPRIDHAETEPRWVETQDGIAALLQRVWDQRVLLSVSVPGHGHQGSRMSMVIDLDASARRLVIDLPHPPLSAAADTPRLLISTRVDGAPLDFTVEAYGQTQYQGDAALLLHWPTRVRYLQRRRCMRLPIPPEINVPPVHFLDEEGVFSGTLLDLSRFGAATLVPGNRRLKPGAELQCAIKIGEHEFMLDAEVRSAVSSLGRLRMGLRFLDVSPSNASKLSAAVAQLERAVLRRAAARRARP